MVHGNVCSTFNANFATALGKISLKHETKSKTNIYKTNKCVKMWKKLLRQTKGKLIPVKVKETEKENRQNNLTLNY